MTVVRHATLVGGGLARRGGRARQHAATSTSRGSAASCARSDRPRGSTPCAASATGCDDVPRAAARDVDAHPRGGPRAALVAAGNVVLRARADAELGSLLRARAEAQIAALDVERRARRRARERQRPRPRPRGVGLRRRTADRASARGAAGRSSCARSVTDGLVGRGAGDVLPRRGAGRARPCPRREMAAAGAAGGRRCCGAAGAASSLPAILDRVADAGLRCAAISPAAPMVPVKIAGVG